MHSRDDQREDLVVDADRAEVLGRPCLVILQDSLFTTKDEAFDHGGYRPFHKPSGRELFAVVGCAQGELHHLHGRSGSQIQ
ncbi:MAG: hypothetical protein O7F08_00140 [Deltaproteobacteria bacterium]|nr:hypothetical protein [Deltaproteobacteria bacterium]